MPGFKRYLAGAVAAVSLIAASSANATTYPVTSFGDAGDGTCDATCTLRDAVANANAHLNDPVSTPDVITFADNVRGAIQLASDSVPITSDGVHINGPGADQLAVVAPAAPERDRVFTLFGFGTTVQDDYDVTISGLTLRGGDVVEADGGAILSADGGFVPPDGPFLCGSLAALTLNGVHVTDNEADGGGGGIAVEGFRCSSFKAGSASTEEGALNVLNSTISDNHTLSEGGGITMRSGSGSLFVSNSTIAGNTAANFGGGISVVRAAGKVETDEPTAYAADNSTITGNDAGDDGGGIFSQADDFGLRSTIVYGNTSTPPEVTKASTPSDLANNQLNGSYAAGYSLIGTRDGANVTDVAGEPNLSANPLLGPLQSNGGPTPTELPATTSPAIDTGIANSLTGDQRGVTRTVDRDPANAADGTDIGAVEVQADPPVPGPEPEPEPTPLPGPPAQLCLGKEVVLTKGGDADEKLTGFGGDDGILGGGGQDLIRGIGGDDCLFGQVGNDKVEGGPGNDNANGDVDNDKVRGEGGDDSVRGQNGDDRVLGGPGNDPKVTGGAGDDYVSGGAGDDFLKGDGGNDVVLLGGGHDFVHAGGGADVINAGDGEPDEIICGTGKDVANVDAIDTVDKDCNTVNVLD